MLTASKLRVDCERILQDLLSEQSLYDGESPTEIFIRKVMEAVLARQDVQHHSVVSDASLEYTNHASHILSETSLVAFRERLVNCLEADPRDYFKDRKSIKNPRSAVATRTLPFNKLSPKFLASLKKIRALKIAGNEVSILSDILKACQATRFPRQIPIYHTIGRTKQSGRLISGYSVAVLGEGFGHI